MSSPDDITYELIVTNPFKPEPIGESLLKENPHRPYMILLMTPSEDPTVPTSLTLEVGNVDSDTSDLFNQILSDLVQPVEIEDEDTL